MVDLDWLADEAAVIKGADDIVRYEDLKIDLSAEPPLRRRYSVTADVLAFRRCSRQYGYFAVRGYVPAQVTQLYFGLVIHSVLDRAHRQFRGLLGGRPAGVPSDQDIAGFFLAVTEALLARGIRPYSQKARESALQYLTDFNSRHGPELYPRVIDTEHKLQVSLEDFVLHGVVDVLAQTAGEAKNGREIWDYKGSQRVASDSAEMENYEFQMQVYAELYRQKNGQFPQRAVLCFLGEKELEDMLVEVPFGKRSISRAMNVFQGTVAEIERRRTLDDWSPPSQIPSRETCGACDIRWDCPTAGHMFPMRHP